MRHIAGSFSFYLTGHMHDDHDRIDLVHAEIGSIHCNAMAFILSCLTARAATHDGASSSSKGSVGRGMRPAGPAMRSNCSTHVLLISASRLCATCLSTPVTCRAVHKLVPRRLVSKVELNYTKRTFLLLPLVTGKKKRTRGLAKSTPANSTLKGTMKRGVIFASCLSLVAALPAAPTFTHINAVGTTPDYAARSNLRFSPGANCTPCTLFFCCWGAHLRSRRFNSRNHPFPPLRGRLIINSLTHCTNCCPPTHTHDANTR